MADNEVRIVINAVDNSKQALKSSETNLASLAKAAAVVTAAVIAMKKGFEFGQEGAQLSRLEASGQALANSYGVSMDQMVEAMKRASQGTVAETDLILSANRAMMLGVTTDATEMANLLEVAALRGRAMGLSTSQAFNDIVTGIGRMSPLILDNLGIVIDLEARTRDWAAANGVATSSIDAATKRQILLSGVLEDGNRQLKEHGGLVYDTAAAYEKFGAQGEDAWNRVKMAFGEFIEPAVSGMADAMEASNELNDMVDALGATYNFTASSADQFRTRMYDLNGATMTAAEIQAYYNQNILRWLHYADLAKGAGQLMSEGIEDVGGAAGQAGGQIEAMTRKWEGFMTVISANSIKGILEDLKFQLAGGFELTQGFNLAQSLAEAGEISPEQAQQVFGALYTEATNIDLALGNITGDEAAANISGTLGLSLEEATSSSESILTNLQTLNGMNVTAEMIVGLHVTGDTWIAQLLSGSASGGFGNIPAGNGDTSLRPFQAEGGPVRGGRPYIVGEEGPELFVPRGSGTIVPNDQLAGGGLTNYGSITVVPPPHVPLAELLAGLT